MPFSVHGKNKRPIPASASLQFARYVCNDTYRKAVCLGWFSWGRHWLLFSSAPSRLFWLFSFLDRGCFEVIVGLERACEGSSDDAVEVGLKYSVDLRILLDYPVCNSQDGLFCLLGTWLGICDSPKTVLPLE